MSAAPRLLSPRYRAAHRLGGGRPCAACQRIAQREDPVVVRREARG